MAEYSPCDTFIFDLDGTLLDTLPDLVAVTQTTLANLGYPSRTPEQILSYVGNGQRALIMQAIPAGSSEAQVDEAVAEWKRVHGEIGISLTVPYPGIAETLQQLKSRGCKLGVLSNKFNAGVQQIIPQFFPDVFDLMYGECEGIPRKPDPTGLLRCLRELGSSAQNCAYVGDSAGDMKVANAAGCLPIGVNWGYNALDKIQAANPAAVIGRAEELLQFAAKGTR